MDAALRPSRAAPASNSRACPPPTSTSGRGLLVLTPACRRAPPRRRVVASPMAGVAAAAAAAAGAGGAAAPLPPRPAHTLASQAALVLATARGALGVAAAMARALVVGSGHSPASPLFLAAAAVPPFLEPVLAGVSAAGAALASNHVFMAGFWAWVAAQVAKVFTKRAKKGVWDLSALVDSGGMPSSHSALAVAVTAAAGRTLGLASATFAVALCYALVVMYDAAGVRRHAGKQAEVLNVLLTDVVSSLQHPEGGGDPHPISSQRLKEVLGHTPRQVAAGAVLGLAVGLLLPLGPGLQAV